MAADWERLADEWKDHPVGLVAEVDCTSDDGKPLCEDFEVQVRLVFLIWRKLLVPNSFYGLNILDKNLMSSYLLPFSVSIDSSWALSLVDMLLCCSARNPL